MKGLKNILKNRNFLRGFFVVLFIANFGLVLDLSAQGFAKSGSELNAASILSASENPQCGVSVVKGWLGTVVNTGNDFFNGIRFSEQKALEDDICPEVISTASLQKKVETNPGVLAFVNNANNSLLAQRPSSGINYLQEKVYALTNPTSVNAQARDQYYSPGGTGFDLLRPIQAFWSWSVRIVYGVLILLIIAMAFGIMFKSKLPVVGEITIQNAIPAITLAMILVPLSYAISGVFIDVITVGTNGVHQFLIGTPASPGYNIYLDSANPTGSDRGYFADDPRVSFMQIRDRINVKDPATAVFNATIQNDNTGLVNNGIITTINTIINSIFNSNPSAPDQSKDFTWLGDVLQLIISIASIWISLKIAVKLFKKYLTMVVSPIISPFIFASVAIPGNGIKSVMDYAKLLWSCSLFYIVTYLMFLLTMIFTDPSFQAGVPNIASGFFRPPLLNIGAIGVDSGSITTTLLTLIGLGIFFSIPSTLDGIDTALGTAGILPKFITTPIESFKDGLSFATKSTVNFAKSTDATVRGISQARVSANAVQRNARIRAMNFADRSRGIRADDSDSWQSKKSREYNAKITDLTQKMEAADNRGDRRARNAYAADIERVKNEAKALGVSAFGVSEDKKADDGSSITASLEPGGIGRLDPVSNTFTFSKDDLKAIRKVVVDNNSDYFLDFKLKLDFKNKSIPSRFDFKDIVVSKEGVLNSVNVMQFIPVTEPNSQFTNIPKVTDRDTTNQFVPFPVSGNPGKIPEDVMLVTMNTNKIGKMEDAFVVESGKTAIKIPLAIHFKKVSDIKFNETFGKYNPANDTFDPGKLQAGLIVSEKRAFTYGTTTSNAITLLFRYGS